MKNGILSLILSIAVPALSAGEIPSGNLKAPVMKSFPDIPFAEEAGNTLRLDLFLPVDIEKPPLIVYIHGGGWKNGSRKNCPALWLVQEGYAVASIDYRLSHQAIFPSQIHDCKGAIRWLRAHGSEYNYDAENIAVMGCSAGGHLAVLLGTSGGMKELEGEVGGHLACSSRVQAVIDYFGPTDFILRAKTQPQITDDPAGTVYQLLGGPVAKNLKLAELAGGINHVSKDDPPLLIVHGLMDKRVEVQQSVSLYQRYKDTGLPVEIKFIENAGHGGSSFFKQEDRSAVLSFLERYLRAEK